MCCVYVVYVALVFFFSSIFDDGATLVRMHRAYEHLVYLNGNKNPTRKEIKKNEATAGCNSNRHEICACVCDGDGDDPSR